MGATVATLAWCLLVLVTLLAVSWRYELAQQRHRAVLLAAKLRGAATQEQLLRRHVEMADESLARISGELASVNTKLAMTIALRNRALEQLERHTQAGHVSGTIYRN